MQVSVETTSGLQRRLTVQVPREVVDQQVEERLRSLGKEVRLDGFRPGKVPLRVLRQRFGGRVAQEVVGEVIQSSFQEAITQERLRPAEGPTIEPIDDGEGVKYSAVFEVLPEVELAALGDLEVRIPVTEITDADVDDMISTLRQQNPIWEGVERGAEKGDRVQIRFDVQVLGEPEPAARDQELTLELGSGRMLEGFEAGLEGASAGDTVGLQLELPADYRDEKLAGRSAEFTVHVNAVEASRVPELDAEFARSFGIASGDLDEFRANARDNMQRQLDDLLRARVKERVLQRLVEAHEIELPEVLVQAQAKEMAKQAKDKQGAEGAEVDADGFVEPARIRVKMQLLLAEVIRRNEIKPDPAQTRARLEAMAASFAMPQQVVDWYYAEEERLAPIQDAVVEDQAIQWLLEHMNVIEDTASFDEVVHQRDGGAEPSAGAGEESPVATG